jgi:hypothetical protein
MPRRDFLASKRRPQFSEYMIDVKRGFLPDLGEPTIFAAVFGALRNGRSKFHGERCHCAGRCSRRRSSDKNSARSTSPSASACSSSVSACPSSCRSRSPCSRAATAFGSFNRDRSSGRSISRVSVIRSHRKSAKRTFAVFNDNDARTRPKVKIWASTSRGRRSGGAGLSC